MSIGGKVGGPQSDRLQFLGLHLPKEAGMFRQLRVNASLQRASISKAQQAPTAHSPYKDKQTEIPSWVPGPRKLRSKSCACLGLLQNLNRMQTAELSLSRRGKKNNTFLTGQEHCSTLIKAGSWKCWVCLPGSPLSSSGRHGPCHPHLPSGRHGGNRQAHRSRYVGSHFCKSTETRSFVNDRKNQ